MSCLIRIYSVCLLVFEFSIQYLLTGRLFVFKLADIILSSAFLAILTTIILFLPQLSLVYFVSSHYDCAGQHSTLSQHRPV